jgi:crotonobetaine/carnitine-CoA ligase
VLPFLLERNASEAPERRCFRFADGETWSCQETLENTRRTAGLLLEQGVSRGDSVLVWLPSGQAMIRAWFAINYIGAIFVPINLDYKGKLLHHAVLESNAKLMIVHSQLVSRILDIEPTPLKRLLCVGALKEMPDLPVEIVTTNLDETGSVVAGPADLNVWDLQMIIFTSGTTGPSKGVMCPYLHMYKTGQCCYGYMTEDDCMLVELPMFHVGGVSSIIGALATRASIALFEGFRTSEFWQRIKDTDATTLSGLIGSMASFLAKAPVQDGEAENSLRMVTLMLNQEAIDVAKRYRFSYTSGFNMTELSVPLLSEVNCRVPGSIGRPRTGCECRVIDEHDYECADDQVGELIVRSDQPWETNIGYLNRPEASAEAWRNGWFHTGDLVRRDESGNFFFVDRLKDAVRRRGENISSLEVEAEVRSYDAVAEAAAVGVPSEYGDEEILVVVVARQGSTVEPRKLAEYLIPRMPHYMVPRYFRVMEQLPKTPTNKITKVGIRKEGVTRDTWDRETAGIKLKKTRLE